MTNCLTQLRPQKAANYPVFGYNPFMNKDEEKRIAVVLVKTLAVMCVRNTGLETLHSGIVPVTPYLCRSL